MRLLAVFTILGLIAAPALVQGSDACNNTKDLDSLSKHVNDALTNLASCTLGYLGDHSGVSTCMASQLGVSSDCADCFADASSCLSTSCQDDCFGTTITNCKSCAYKNCVPDFSTCSGVAPPAQFFSSVL
eukprot:TRINITY_DN13033_c0_g1_i1.p1 TRINITY_DN13033_c0_g1~~TRINITY_DN13033_c0_g1_i1.p1  ORF type:complete len:130 (-),score=28.64 TRINITY_DN13033_c0_g1_i1:62-451(-)